MKSILSRLSGAGDRLFNSVRLKLRPKLILIFIIVKVIPLVLLTVIAWNQIAMLGDLLRDIAVEDSSAALNDIATDNIERMTTDTAKAVADFLYGRDADILSLAQVEPSFAAYLAFGESSFGRVINKSDWTLSADGKSWVSTQQKKVVSASEGSSTNPENNDMEGYHYRPADDFSYENIPLYDEITFVGLSGMELYKYVSPNSTKVNYPLSQTLRDVSKHENTYVKAENYFEKLKELKPGDIYVSDVIGAYVGSNYIGMYTPETVESAATGRGYDIAYDPEGQSYAGAENPEGRRFEGIVRWATPVTDDAGAVIGYVTFALNHDHIMEFVDHLTPMSGRYTELPSAAEGNYAFIWDYKCRSICHPRHHSIVGYDPETGGQQVPWLETSIYDGWRASGVDSWEDYVTVAGIPEFDAQSREKKPAAALTKAGLVGLDGRYLNNAPQCTGWMDLTKDGGSGSFYILWSGLYKLTTAGAIPYYTGQYAPSEENGYSRRGFGIVTIGAGLEDFMQPAVATEFKLDAAIERNLGNTTVRLTLITAALLLLVILVAIWLASSLTGNITVLINGISRFRSGERQFRFRSNAKDEFGTLADSFDEMAESIVTSVTGPICITDMDQSIIYMNDEGLRHNKKTLAEVIGRPYSENSIYPPGSVYCPIRALEKGSEAEVYHEQESGHYFKGTANYMYGTEGEKTGYIITSTDVTEIQVSREKAEQASRAKGDFLSNMSHEMRTPLNAVIGMTTIGKTAPDIERKDYAFEKIEEASVHLLGVINDILDMSKIESGKFDLSPTEFHFERMVKKAINVNIFRIDEKHQQFGVYIDPEIPSLLVGDEQRLSQVVTNLLSNAVKFTPENGSIRIEAHLVKLEGAHCTLRMDVTDTGIGISDEQRARLFSSFQQAESSTSRKFGGTGLGLVISKSIVEMMDGRIWVDSALGKGSTFSFEVALLYSGAKPEGLVSKNRKSLRILAVDDDAGVREFFASVAGHTGFRCDTADSGAEAIGLIEKNGAYDVYFVDWKMPGMDGIELTRHIKDGHSNNSRSVVIMISAAEWSSVEKQAHDARVDRFLSKPLFASSIIDSINECLGAPAASEKPHADTGGLKGSHVLLAEDMEINREILLALLEPTEISIDCVKNGQEAVEAFAADPDKYALIFMDVQMPEMDGFEATRRIRAIPSPRAKDIPIVAMTANVFREDVEKCLEAGMNDHLGKPLDLDEVLNVLHKYIKSTVGMDGQ